MPNPRVFFDFAIDNSQIGRHATLTYSTPDLTSYRVVFELFADHVPNTVENFRALTTGEKGISRLSQVPLYYKDSIIHRSIPGFMIQGGDFTQRNGKGGESIHGSPFPDEDLSRPLDSEGLLAMANKGPNTNGSQWFITLAPCPHLNGKHVVFGKVIRGYQEVIQRIAAVPTDEKDRPSVPVVITHCGELELRKPPAAQPVKKVKAPVTPPDSESEDSDHGVDPYSRTKRDDRPSRQSRRSRSRSHSPSQEDEDRDGDARLSKKKKEKKRKRSRDADKVGKSREKKKNKITPPPPSEPRKETEEEYDARLEREENERLAEKRRRELERLKDSLSSQQRSDSHAQTDGIRYKGRGRMQYVDPETRNDNRRY